MLEFSADDILGEVVSSAADVEAKYDKLAEAFFSARTSALENTRLYLSMVNDLDVYVATSMRTRADFRSMAERCERIFSNSKIQDLHLRYFDPTMSAADGHQDKGLIECLMVKCERFWFIVLGRRKASARMPRLRWLSVSASLLFSCVTNR